MIVFLYTLGNLCGIPQLRGLWFLAVVCTPWMGDYLEVTGTGVKQKRTRSYYANLTLKVVLYENKNISCDIRKKYSIAEVQRWKHRSRCSMQKSLSGLKRKHFSEETRKRVTALVHTQKKRQTWLHGKALKWKLNSMTTKPFTEQTPGQWWSMHSNASTWFLPTSEELHLSSIHPLVSPKSLLHSRSTGLHHVKITISCWSKIK